MKKLNIQNILVPIDFSETSIRAIRTAKYLAQKFQANVHLANICPQYYAGFYAAPAPVPLPAFAYLDNVRNASAQRLNRLAKEHRLAGATFAEIGAPVFDEICRIAKQIPADLIVTSTHGHTGLKHVFLGSTAERLVQHSPCPVLVVREKNKKPSARGKSKAATIDTIVVPVDFSRCSLAGLDYAIRFAEKFAARIVLVHVVDLGPLLTADGYAMYDLSYYRELACANAKKQMQRLVRTVKFGGVKFETLVVLAPSADGICTAAQNNNADLIITATHGRTGLKHVLIGSTAEVVVRHARCPVLVVPSHPAVRTANLTKAATAKKGREQSRSRSPTKATRGKPANGFREIAGQPFPERRKTNKFRESHLASR